MGGLFISARVFSLYDAIHGWMDGSHDEKVSQKMTTTSFTICNALDSKLQARIIFVT
jgi:hypothetical protein